MKHNQAMLAIFMKLNNEIDNNIKKMGENRKAEKKRNEEMQKR